MNQKPELSAKDAQSRPQRAMQTEDKKRELIRRTKECLYFLTHPPKRTQTSYQLPAQGCAVTGFIFILVSFIFWGWVPLLTFIGLACVLIALAKGNHSGTVVVGCILAVVALVLAYRHAAEVGYFASDSEAMQQSLSSSVNGIIDWVKALMARIVSKLSSLVS